MSRKVVVVDVEALSNGTYKVVLQRGKTLVSCTDIEIWDPTCIDNDLFEEWKCCAHDQVEGFSHYCVE